MYIPQSDESHLRHMCTCPTAEDNTEGKQKCQERLHPREDSRHEVGLANKLNECLACGLEIATLKCVDPVDDPRGSLRRDSHCPRPRLIIQAITYEASRKAPTEFVEAERRAQDLMGQEENPNVDKLIRTLNDNVKIIHVDDLNVPVVAKDSQGPPTNAGKQTRPPVTCRRHPKRAHGIEPQHR